MIVDAVYDFLCPWCFVGKRHFDLAVAQVKPVDLTVRWRQYMLYPHFDRGGHDFLEFFESKYGETLRVPMWDSIRIIAKPIGINFRFEDMTRGPASLDGHRLVRYAGTIKPGVEPAMIEHISSSFFEQAKVIDNDFLLGTAEMFGLDKAATATYMASDADIEPLFEETKAWQAKGVSSMPCYIFDDGRYVIRQTSIDTFVQALS